MLEFEQILPTKIRRWLRTGHRVVYPDPSQELKGCFSSIWKEIYSFESYEILREIAERKKANQGRKVDHDHLENQNVS